jgi:hypothetical protein
MRLIRLITLTMTFHLVCLSGLSSADSLTIGVKNPGVIPMNPDKMPKETWVVYYHQNGSPAKGEAFGPFNITNNDVANATAKATAIANGINGNVPAPTNLTVVANMANVKISTTGGFLLQGLEVTQFGGTDAKKTNFQLGEMDVINPIGLLFKVNLAAALAFQGAASGDGTAVVSIGGPGGSTTPITVATTAGESASSLVSQLAASVNSMTSFTATPNGSTLLIGGLSTDNTFGAQLTDNGFSSFTESLNAVPEPSTLVLGAIAALCLLAGAVAKSPRQSWLFRLLSAKRHGVRSSWCGLPRAA